MIALRPMGRGPRIQGVRTGRPRKVASEGARVVFPGTQTNRASGTTVKREFARLMGIQEHLLSQFQLIRSELEAPNLLAILREIRARSTSSAPEALRDVASAVEEALRALKVCASEIRRELEEERRELEVEGIPNLPARLARFLAERRDVEGFTYQVTQDRLRGWVIRWKEYGADGSIRGAGQFAERPYAWLDD